MHAAWRLTLHGCEDGGGVQSSGEDEAISGTASVNSRDGEVRRGGVGASPEPPSLPSSSSLLSFPVLQTPSGPVSTSRD